MKSEKKLISHADFFELFLVDKIKLTNNRDADIFSSWKVGGQDFYIYGVVVKDK